MKIRTFISMALGVILTLCVCADVTAQQSLKEMAEQDGGDWLVGTWSATTNDGTTIKLSYAWTAGGHAARVEYHMGRIEGSGLIYYSAEDDAVHEVGVNSEGRVSKGTWIPPERGHLNTVYESKDDWGAERSMGIARSLTPEGKMLLEVYEVSNGAFTGEARWSIELAKVEK